MTGTPIGHNLDQYHMTGTQIKHNLENELQINWNFNSIHKTFLLIYVHTSLKQYCNSIQVIWAEKFESI